MFKKSIAATFSLNIYTVIIGFVNSVLATRLLGAEGRGIFAIYTSAVELLALFLGLGIPHALIYFSAKDTFDRDRLFNSTFLFLMAVTGLFTLLLFLSQVIGIETFFLPTPYNGTYPKMAIIGFFFCVSGWYLFVSILNGHRYFVQTNVISFVTISGTFIFYAFLFLNRNPTNAVTSPEVFYGIQVLMAGLTLFLCFYFYHRLLSKGHSLQLLKTGDVKSIVSYGLTYYVSNFMLFASMKLDYWFVNYYAGSAELGIYVLASNVGLTMLLLPNSIGLVLSAFKASDTMNKVDDWTAFLCRFTFTACLLLALILWVFGGTIIQFLYGDEFAPSAKLLYVLLAGVVPYGIFAVLKSYFAGAGQLNELVYAALIGVVITVVLDILLIKPFGSTGAAIASISAYCSVTAFAVWRFKSNTGILASHLFLLLPADYGIIFKAVRSQFKFLG